MDEKEGVMQEVVNAINAMAKKLAKKQEIIYQKQAKDSQERTRLLVEAITRFGGRDGAHIGRVGEALVAGALSTYMKKHFGIVVDNDPQRRLKLFDRKTDKVISDIDVMVIGAGVVVIVEVKNTISESQITGFKRVLQGVVGGSYYAKKENLPQIAGKKVYGGIAFFGCNKKTNEDKIVNTVKASGLFAMRILRKSNVESCNQKGFVPQGITASNNLLKDG